MSDIESMIAALEDMSSSDLSARWRVLTRTPVPRVSPRLLRLALAWEIQAGKLGGRGRDTIRFLDQRARGATRTDRRVRACGWCANGGGGRMSSRSTRTSASTMTDAPMDH